MIGAIIGDIVGSVYEWNNIRTKQFPFFRDDCFFTDDTVMTCAVAQALMDGGKANDFIDAMKELGRMYPDSGYGGRFDVWLNSNDTQPYNSWGNGSAMRVSPVGFFVSLDTDPSSAEKLTLQYAKTCSEVTHNHPEGIKGAVCVAHSILFMRRSRHSGADIEKSKSELKRRITSDYGYDLSRTLDEIRPTYFFNESCQDTVPQAITAFLESADFEDAIRNAISLGGDSDTLAAITGGIAQAAYGVPQWMTDKALTYLSNPLKDIYFRWEKYTGRKKRQGLLR